VDKKLIDMDNASYGDNSKEMEELIKKSFADKLSNERRAKRLTQEKLAARAGVSEKYIGELENEKKSPTLMMISKIAKGLNINPAALVCNESCLKRERNMTVINEILLAQDPATIKKIEQVLKVVFGKNKSERR
jgi:transcriptional regulator with XRE-family HTH domain